MQTFVNCMQSTAFCINTVDRGRCALVVVDSAMYISAYNQFVQYLQHSNEPL